VAGRAKYTDDDKARVFVVLGANDGNVKRTARETGVPENTVRRWRDEWEKNGPPPTDMVEGAVGDFVSDAERVRNKALLAIEQKIPQAKVSELNNTVGILTDKIDRARGLVDRRVVEHQLPSGDQIREALGTFAAEMMKLSQRREAEIVDAEIVEQPALPKGQ
jgi:transposase-like protein